MNSAETRAMADGALMHTYNRFPVVFDRGEGVYLIDTDGKRYLDFGAGIAVCALGYSNETYKNALKRQIDKLMHTSNLYYTEPLSRAAVKLQRVSGMDRIFFTNSGTEAIEGAIKLAKKAAWMRDPSKEYEIVAMEHSFHGRSMGALGVTGNPHYREPFGPLIGKVHFAEFNNLDSVRACVNEATCAVILEPVQGEGGIYPAEPDFLQGVRQLCDERNIVLIFDEIQCGMGRTGTMFAYQQYGVKPDILTIAKALGNGLPIGAFGAVQKVADAFLPGDHGTTYGGNPLAATAAETVLDLYESMHLVEHVRELTPYLEQTLDKLQETCPVVTGRRGKGLMQGLILSIPAASVVSAALENGLVVMSAGETVVRLVPPLVIEKQHVDEMASILERILK